MNYTHVFAVPGRGSCIDFQHPDTGRSAMFGQSLAEVRDREPGAQLMTVEEFRAAARAAFTKPPVEIDEERFTYLLEVLPPRGWVRRLDAESFKMSEFTCNDITCCAVRIGRRYFSTERTYTTTHDELVQIVLAAFPDLINGN